MKYPDIPDELDADKLAEVALALLALTLHDGSRAWKGLDWAVMDLLFKRGWIHDPQGKAKSVVLTDTGLALAQDLLLKHFGRSSKE
jgi:hypothetical protein